MRWRLELGATPSTGTLTHIRRRIETAGIDISHFAGIGRGSLDLPFTDEELRAAAASADSIRAAARTLGIPDDGRARTALGRAFKERRIDTSHFSHSRISLPEQRLRLAVREATGYADVMRALDLEVNDTNHRRVRRKDAGGPAPGFGTPEPGAAARGASAAGCAVSVHILR